MQTSPTSNPYEVFISYSHRDTSFKKKLINWLAALVREKKINIWDDSRILPGQEWSKVIMENLDSASIVLLLISSDFINSYYAYDIEMKSAVNEKKAVLVPILIRDADLEGFAFSEKQFLPSFGKPVTKYKPHDTGYLEIVRGLRELIKSLENKAGDDVPIVKHNLPTRLVSYFVGRRIYFEHIMQHLVSQQRGIISIEGFQGIGKTSLAIEIGYACLNADYFKTHPQVGFEQIIWIPVNDTSSQADLMADNQLKSTTEIQSRAAFNDILDIIAMEMGYSSIAQKAEKYLDIKKDELLAYFKDRRVLLIIDNFERIPDPRVFAWLAEIPLPNKVLITSRAYQALATHSIDLKSFNVSEALEFVQEVAKESLLPDIHEEAKSLRSTIPPHLQLHELSRSSESKLLSLIKLTDGNPKAIELALGLLQGRQVELSTLVKSLVSKDQRISLYHVFEHFQSNTWANLSESAKIILKCAPLFSAASSMSYEALYATSGLTIAEFESGLQQLHLWKFMETDGHGNLVIHPITLEFSKGKLSEEVEFENAVRTRWADHYLNFVARHVIRKSPKIPYWNALVTDRMESLDPEWITIQSVLHWVYSERDYRLFYDFVILLVHYLDSRLLNQKRIMFVKQAIEAAGRINEKYTEAIFYIDALSWTYIEENEIQEAKESIKMGQDIIAELPPSTDISSLLALSHAWIARADIQNNKIDEAEIHLKKALEEIAPFIKKVKPWIKFRLYMTEGDLFFKFKDYRNALRCYKKAKGQSNTYGGEGHDYQIDPRIGLSYLGIDEDLEAEAVFKQLIIKLKNIEIGRLYAEYGLGILAFKRGFYKDANSILTKCKEELSKKTTSNLLLNLIEEYLALMRKT